MEEKPKTIVAGLRKISTLSELKEFIFPAGRCKGYTYLEVKNTHLASYLLYLYNKNIDYKNDYFKRTYGVIEDDFNPPYEILFEHKDDFMKQALQAKEQYLKSELSLTEKQLKDVMK